jgi:hypothetical protein
MGRRDCLSTELEERGRRRKGTLGGEIVTPLNWKGEESTGEEDCLLH